MNVQIKEPALPVAGRICAVITGAVLFLSGMLKLMDPLGAGLIVQDYFKFFHLAFLPDFASKWLGFVLAFLETSLGACLIGGIYRKIIRILTSALLAFFTLITLILLIFNPEMDCGCFGEAIHLTHLQTFVKNIILCLLAFAAFRSSGTGKNNKKTYIKTLVVMASCLFFAVYSQVRLPLMDFTDFAPGAELIAAQKNISPNPGDEVCFIYEKNGQKGVFTLSNLPDSTWTFVSSGSVELRSDDMGQSFPVLSIRNSEGIYLDSLAAQGKVLLVSAYAPGDFSSKKWAHIGAAMGMAEARGITSLLILPESGQSGEGLEEHTVISDIKTIMTLNRSNGGFTYLSDGEIIRKWASGQSLTEKSFDEILNENPTELMLDKSTKDRLTFQAVLLYAFLVLLFV